MIIKIYPLELNLTLEQYRIIESRAKRSGKSVEQVCREELMKLMERKEPPNVLCPR